MVWVHVGLGKGHAKGRESHGNLSEDRSMEPLVTWFWYQPLLLTFQVTSSKVTCKKEIIE